MESESDDVGPPVAEIPNPVRDAFLCIENSLATLTVWLDEQVSRLDNRIDEVLKLVSTTDASHQRRGQGASYVVATSPSAPKT